MISRRRKQHSGRKNLLGIRKTAAPLILFCVCIIFAAGVAAKYLKETTVVNSAVAKEFYFTSDLLDGATHEITALENNGTASVTFQLMNHADALRYSEVAVPYTVTVSGGSGTPIVMPSEGELSGGSVRDASITVSGMKEGETYTITAVTNGSYTETLTGTFEIHSTDKSVHNGFSDHGAYVELTLWTADYSGAVELNYPEGLIPDNTDSEMEKWDNAAGVSETKTVTFGTNSSHTFRFFKSDASKSYAVSVNGTEVTVSAE